MFIKIILKLSIRLCLQNVLSWAQSIQLVPISGDRDYLLDRAQLSRFLLKTGTESSPNCCVFLNKISTIDDFKKHSNRINIPSSQTFWI
jgi:hypothetical protein